MLQDPQFPADLITFTKEILNGKLHFLCSVSNNTDVFIAVPHYMEYFTSIGLNKLWI